MGLQLSPVVASAGSVNLTETEANLLYLRLDCSNDTAFGPLAGDDLTLTLPAGQSFIVDTGVATAADGLKLTGTFTDGIDLSGATCGIAMVTASGTFDLTFGASDFISLDFASTNHTSANGIEMVYDSAADGLYGIHIDYNSQGDFTGGAFKASVSSGGMLTALDVVAGFEALVGTNASDVGNTFNIGSKSIAADVRGGAGGWLGHAAVANTGVLGADLDNTGLKAGFFINANAIGGGFPLYGMFVQIKTETVATPLTGVSVEVEPLIAGASHYGINIKSAGSQPLDAALRLESGTFTVGLDLSGTTITTDIELASGVINITSGTLTLQTSTSGDIDVIPASGSAFNVKEDMAFIGAGSGLEFAQIYDEDGSSTLELAAQDTYYQVTAFSVNGESNGAVPDHTNDHITITKTGKYLVAMNIGVSSSNKNEYDFHIQKNNGAADFAALSAHRTTNVANSVGNASCTGIIDLTVGDTVELWVKRLDGGGVSKTIAIENASISVVQIGG